ncbi:MAG: UDP-3-O-acyl-N-acetylglucosamine deacetylase [Deltaproteobacteria bacterium]|nr:UDP-3-O-acyl-N-acetylglucosamine deacetylase [Deltaproteobacteria bacterium]
MFQTTVNKTIEFSGIGLHTGSHATVKILPCGKDKGIRFIRKDIPHAPVIKAKAKNVVATHYSTTLGKDGVTVSTVEHLLAAFYGLGIDNAAVEVYGPEIPIMDGSAAPITELIMEAGIRELTQPRRYLVITKPIEVRDKDKYVRLLPPDREGERAFTIDYTIDFSHPYLSKQSFSITLSPAAFREEVVSARTFGFLRDVELLRENGLVRGGTLKNAVVIGESDILNEGGLRFPDEFVRHKVLDLIGDISLLGVHIAGRLNAHRSGHTLNHALVKKVIKNPETWKVVEFVEEELADVSPQFRTALATA